MEYLLEFSGVFGRLEGMEFRSNLWEVMAKVMGIDEISNESIKDRGQGLWFRIVGIYAFKVWRRKSNQ